MEYTYEELLEAYRKLKTYIYYDSSNLIMRSALAEFETGLTDDSDFLNRYLEVDQFAKKYDLVVIGPNCIGNVNRVPHRRQLTFRIHLAVVRPDDVVDLLARLTISPQPSLDDLDSIKVSALRIFTRSDKE